MALIALPTPDPADAWQDDAACLGMDPEAFTPEVATEAELRAAMAVCAGCDVRVRCLELAESQSGAYGIHGGRWFGAPPAAPDSPECEWCGRDLPARGEGGGNGTPRRFCGGACRKRAERAHARTA